MVEALYNASGLALYRDDRRQPRDRGADQHLERPLRLDVAARRGLDPALRRVEPGGGGRTSSRPSSSRRSFGAGDGLHGRIRADARRRAGRPGTGAGRRVPSAVRAPAGARSGRACDDRRDGRPGGVRRGAVLAHAKQMAALDLVPEIAAEFAQSFERPWAGCCGAIAARTPRPSSSRWVRCSARSRTSSTSCASTVTASARSASGAFRPWPLDEVRAALCTRSA